MTHRISRRGFMSRVGVAGAAAGVGYALPNAGASAAIGPNPDASHITPRGRGFRVLPSGGDDRVNLEWALCNTSAGGTVELVAGTYKLGGAAIVPDFDGRLVGAGAGRTTLTCTDEYSYEVWEKNGKTGPRPEPFPRLPIDNSLTRSAPGLILFYKTPLIGAEDAASRANRIEIKDLRCRGAMIGSPWTFGDEVLCFTILNSVDWHNPNVSQEPTRQDVLLTRVLVDGYRSAELGLFENGCACITVLGAPILSDNYDLTGATDGDALGLSNGALLGVTPAEGDVTFRDCKFVNCRLGPGVVGHKDSLLVFDHIETDGCRGNCVQLFDNSNCDIVVRDCNLFNETFLLPPALAPQGAEGIPSSLGCIAVFQGSGAAVGVPSNLRWLSLAFDPAAREGKPEAGPLGTWRPLGPANVPEPSRVRIVDNRCVSPGTENSYCVHAIDAANLAYNMPSLSVDVVRNRCVGSQTCISLEHLNDGAVRWNRCRGISTGVELHNAAGIRVRNNRFRFTGDDETTCEVLTLAPGQKQDFWRPVPGAGSCTGAG